MVIKNNVLLTKAKVHIAKMHEFSQKWRPTHFLGHPTAACPRSVIHAGQKCPQFCGIGRSWTLNELCLELVPQESPRERDPGNTVVETRLCRATKSCGVHKPASKRATARCPGSIKTYSQSSRGLRNWAQCTVHHLDPLFTADFQARLHVQRRPNVKSARDARDRHSSRGRRL